MLNKIRTTGLIMLIIWAAFFIIGLTEHRPFICIVSGLFFAVGFYRRVRIIKRKDPVELMWEGYTRENPDMKDYPYEFWRFQSGEDMQLYEKLKDGIVRAQSFSVDFFEANAKPFPSVGQINIVCCDDKVVGIGKTVEIIRTTFGHVDKALALMEGFPTLAKWRTAKKKVFGILCERMGMRFSDDLEIIFEIFEIVYTLEDMA